MIAGAEWCTPCIKQLEILSKFESLHGTKYKVCTLDTDESINVVKKYSIKGVPLLMLFIDGVNVASKSGLTNLDSLEKFVIQHL